jgi:hypothetical protein
MILSDATEAILQHYHITEDGEQLGQGEQEV